MPEHNKHILCTRPVDTSRIEKAKLNGMIVDILSFIETEPVQTIEIQQEIEWASVQQAIVVFTSMNAVEAVTGMLDGYIPDWRIYCIGHKTKQLIEEYFGKNTIAGFADNAAELADRIIENEEPEEVIFFCGNLRRDELPDRLRKNQIAINEIIVYKTIAVNHTIEKEYDGVLFFSPSAVESFFKKNVLPGRTVAFSIGNTTSESVRKYCSNKIITAKLPGKEELVEQATDYFNRGE